MKQPISILFMLLIAASLVAQNQATNGCSLYGHACYGGHGKRSVGLVGDETQPQIYNPNDDKEFQQYPRYRVMKIIRQMMEGGKRLRTLERMNNDMEYQSSNEI